MAAPSEAAALLKTFLERSWGSSLKAWITAFDVENVQRIHKIEFIEIMRKSGYIGNIQQIFNELFDDSGEISMSKIDPEQADLWTRFREWCLGTFRSVDELLTRLGKSNEERFKNRQTIKARLVKNPQTIKARLAALNEAQFKKRVQELGWEHGQEALLFSALDTEGSGVLRREHFRWLEAEYRRIKRKIEAKSQAIHSLKKQQANDARLVTLGVFKQALIKKHGNLVRGFRMGLANDQLILPKTQFLKACAVMGFSHEARDLYKMLDKEQCGFASLEELDPPTAEQLAKFKKFLESNFGGACRNAFNLEGDRKMAFPQFESEVKQWGYHGNIKKIFQYLDRDGRKTLEDSDLRFLDKWTPSPYFLVEANHVAKEEVKELLNQKYNGHFMKAWRHLLDKDGSNRVTWSEFQSACHKLRYTGDVAGAWRAFDADLSGYLTLNEVDTEASDTLCEYKGWAWEEFGTVRAAFGVFDHDNSNSLSFEEFRSNCRIYGYEGNAKKLFDALDINGEKTLSMSEIAFLDDWDMGQSQGRSKDDKRKSHIRQMNESLKRQQQISHSAGRPTRGPMDLAQLKSISTIKENVVSENETDRSQKVTRAKQGLQLRADLPLIPFYRWPMRRIPGPGEEEDPHRPYHCEQRKGRERKHWVQEAAQDFLPKKSPWLKPLEDPIVPSPSLPRSLLKPTLDELLRSKGRFVLGLVPRLPSVPKLTPLGPSLR